MAECKTEHAGSLVCRILCCILCGLILYYPGPHLQNTQHFVAFYSSASYFTVISMFSTAHHEVSYLSMASHSHSNVSQTFTGLILDEMNVFNSQISPYFYCIGYRFASSLFSSVIMLSFYIYDIGSLVDNLLSYSDLALSALFVGSSRVTSNVKIKFISHNKFSNYYNFNILPLSFDKINDKNNF